MPDTCPRCGCTQYNDQPCPCDDTHTLCAACHTTLDYCELEEV